MRLDARETSYVVAACIVLAMAAFFGAVGYGIGRLDRVVIVEAPRK